MERVLKDYLVENSDNADIYYSMTCTVCGSVWKSAAQKPDRTKANALKETAAQQAAVHNCVCNFCGRPVCRRCIADVEGILLCIQCGDKLRSRLDSNEGKRK